MRLPTTLKWDAALMQSVNVTPFDQHVAPQPEVIFKPDETAKDMQVRPDERTIARKVYIRQEDLQAFGYTRECAKCQHEIQHGPNKSGKPHSAACRARSMEELNKTEAGRMRIQAATERLDRTVAELGERMLSQEEIAMEATAPVVVQQPQPRFE